MCVIFFYVNSSPQPGGYKLILASNRDEFFARETRAAAKWDLENNEKVYGGIDLEAGREGGTWLAIGGHEGGIIKVGALLNLTGEPKPRNAVGRGMLVTDFVRHADNQHSIEAYNRQLVADCSKYSAFNFISIEIGTHTTPAHITLCSNVPPTLEHYEERKCYGFGNSLPAVPFEKVRYGQQQFEQIVNEFHCNNGSTTTQAELIAQLKNLLKCKNKFWPDDELQRRAPNWGEQLSALNVTMFNEGYGSRTHTIILVDADDKMHFIEETMVNADPTAEWLQTHIVKDFA